VLLNLNYFRRQRWVGVAIIVVITFIFLSLIAISVERFVSRDDEGLELSGGVNFTTFDLSGNCFGHSGQNLSDSVEGDFVTGNSFFRTNWVVAPASVKVFDGLGPIMNAISCGSCHFKDGRGRPQEFNEPLRGLIFRFSLPDKDQYNRSEEDPNYGGQFQDKSILHIFSEGRVQTTYKEINFDYPDKSKVRLRQPVYDFLDLRYGPLESHIQISPRIAQQLPGLGLLENVPEETILGFADEKDRNNDGISGRPNYVWIEAAKVLGLGRFGWKANQPSLHQQIAAAFVNDIGITSTLYPRESLTPTQQTSIGQIPNGGDPEISDRNLQKVVTYVKLLAVPASRYRKTSVRGALLFDQINCSLCHIPIMQTGNKNKIDALNRQIIRPYSDLLLHDMGPGLSDNRPDFQAQGVEWRTPPLWGLGMVETVNKHSFYLHDGRARSLEEAILWHGGEALSSKEQFCRLSKYDREALIAFLKSL